MPSFAHLSYVVTSAYEIRYTVIIFVGLLKRQHMSRALHHFKKRAVD